jgi:hypothetical protein
MDERWKKRLREITLAAGGAVLLGGCMPGGCCNANPDPCCSAPEGDECKAATDCMDKGRTWVSANNICLPDDGGAQADDLLTPIDAAHD